MDCIAVDCQRNQLFAAVYTHAVQRKYCCQRIAEMYALNAELGIHITIESASVYLLLTAHKLLPT